MELMFMIFTIMLGSTIASLVIWAALKPSNHDSETIPKRHRTRLDPTEKHVADNLNRLDPNFYTVFNNVMLPSRGNTSTTQIDHIVVSRFGIFCIETKSHKGWIFGSSDQKQWTQVLYRDKYRFYNPIYQNFAHTKALELLLGQNLKSRVISLIAFPNAGKVKVDNKEINCSAWDVVEKISQCKVRVYDPGEYDRIVGSIQAANITDQETVEWHNNEVRSFINSVHA